MENRVLAACIRDRGAYELVRPLLNDSVLSDTGGIVFGMVDEYYQHDPQAEVVDVDTLKDRVERRYPMKVDYLHHVLDNLANVSVQNVEKDFIEMRRTALNQNLSEAFMANDDSRINELLAEYNSFNEHVGSQEKQDSVYVNEDLSNLLTMTDDENLIRVYPDSLNERLGGGLPKPCHILIYARPETGKSATCINMASGFVNHGHKTLYICNEDNSKVMLLRFICRLSGMTLPEVRANPDQAREKAEARGYGNLVYAGLTPGTLDEVEELIKTYEPECVVIDQIRNMTHKNDNKVERLELIAQGLRDMSNRYEVAMVSVTQAGDSAHNKLILDMGDVDYSNTGIPGAVDAMIGIGMDEASERQGFRFLTPSKNKIGGGNHNPVKVKLEPAYSRVTSA